MPRNILNLVFIALVIFISTCAGNIAAGGATSGNNINKQREGVIIFKNKTPFTVHIVRGSGRVDVGTIAPLSSLNIINIFDSAESYYPLFDIPIIDSWQLQRVRPDERDYYFQIDNSLLRQEIDITMPAVFADTSAYIILKNNSRSGGVTVSQNDSNDRMTGINFIEIKSNINTGEIIVYRVNPQNIKNLRVNPLNKNFGNIVYKSGFVYTFIYDGNEIQQIDTRPLNEIKTPTPVMIEFTGSALSLSEQQDIIAALNDSIKNYNVLFKIISSNDATYKDRIFYLMKIYVNIKTLPPTPPVNHEILQAEFSLILLRNGKELLKSAEFKDIKDMSRNIIIRSMIEQVKSASSFYKDVNIALIL